MLSVRAELFGQLIGAICSDRPRVRGALAEFIRELIAQGANEGLAAGHAVRSAVPVAVAVPLAW